MTVTARIEPSEPGRHEELIAFVATAQADPTRHITYVGEDVATLLGEFAEAEQWADRLMVAFIDDGIAGALLADIDHDMRRVWWVGPWASSESIARQLVVDARSRFGSMFEEEEMAPDSRNAMVRSLAAGLGFVEDTPSAVLSKVGLDPSGTMGSLRLTPELADAVADLHDRVFAGTHTPGSKLVAADRTRIRVIETDAGLAGYIAYEVQQDRTGYIDFLGVAEDHRRQGVGRTLVADACRELAAEGAPAMHLTVRADAPSAIDLYRGEGFVEERRIVPCRNGFTLG